MANRVCGEGGHVWQTGGVCDERGMRGIQRDTEIRSMSGQYASYWNAFLLMNQLQYICQPGQEVNRDIVASVQ